MNEIIKRKYQYIIADMKDCFIDLLQKEWDILLLITRKGYWAYKTLMDEAAWNSLDKRVYSRIQNREKRIYTDRYLCKTLDLKEFQNKKIYIYDDTMTRGANLFYYYSFLIQNGIDADRITPVVYALSTEYPSEQSHNMLLNEFQRISGKELEEERWKALAEERIKQFNKALFGYVRLTPESLSEVCVCETMLFNENLCPLVIDLPILSTVKKENVISTIPAYMNNGKGEGIQFTKEQFQKLTSGDAAWKFVRNDFSGNYVRTCSSYFENEDIDTGNLGNAIQNLVVKCKYKVEGDKVRAVFVPFAIFRSMSFTDVLNSFNVLWKGTEHWQEIADYIKRKIISPESAETDQLSEDMFFAGNPEIRSLMQTDHNLYTNLFRSVIFFVSAYIGYKFKEYVKESTGIQLDYDWNFMEESLSQAYINSFHELIRPGEDYRNYFMKIPVVQHISSVDLSLIFNEPKKIATKELIEKSIRNRIIYKKNLKENEPEQYDEKFFLERVYVFETIESDLDREFIFGSIDEKKTLLTMVLIDMLENSRLGNEIYVDNKKEIIYRGFRTGENSEILFYSGIEYFYAYIFAYYHFEREEHAGDYREQYKKNYQKFIDQLELYFITKKYKGSLISSEDMKFYEEYFRNLEGPRLDEQIMNKYYVLDTDGNSDDSMGIRQFVDQAYRNVRVWMN